VVSCLTACLRTAQIGCMGPSTDDSGVGYVHRGGSEGEPFEQSTPERWTPRTVWIHRDGGTARVRERRAVVEHHISESVVWAAPAQSFGGDRSSTVRARGLNAVTTDSTITAVGHGPCRVTGVSRRCPAAWDTAAGWDGLEIRRQQTKVRFFQTAKERCQTRCSAASWRSTGSICS
jgi:hypothetical protein